MKLDIWDTDGHDNSNYKLYLQNSSVIILVFGLDSPSSFKELNNYKENVDDYTNNHPIIIIVGNKSDLEYERRVAYDELCEKAADLGVEHFYEVSCLD